MHVERLGVAEVVRPPDPVDEHVTREHPARVRQQQLEQLELLERQRDLLAAHAHLVAAGVEADVADLEHLAVLGHGALVADGRAAARRARARRARAGGTAW